MVEAEGVGKALLSQSLLGKHSGGAMRTLLALSRVEQHELFDLVEFGEQEFDGKAGPNRL